MLSGEDPAGWIQEDYRWVNSIFIIPAAGVGCGALREQSEASWLVERRIISIRLTECWELDHGGAEF